MVDDQIKLISGLTNHCSSSIIITVYLIRVNHSLLILLSGSMQYINHQQ